MGDTAEEPKVVERGDRRYDEGSRVGKRSGSGFWTYLTEERHTKHDKRKIMTRI